MKSRLIVAAGLILFLPMFASAKPKTLANVSLAYTPTTTLGEKQAIDLSGLLKVKLQIGEIEDVRTDKALVAENREDADKGKILKVTTKDDVGAWVKEQVSKTLGQHGFLVVENGGDFVLSAEVRRFFVTETGTYQADIGLLVTLSDAKGKELWQGMVSGSAERWGRSFKLENYQEAWSDGLFEAIYSMVASDDFRKALGQ